MTLKTQSADGYRLVDDFKASALSIEHVLPTACRELKQIEGSVREGCDALLADLKAIAAGA